jgi:WhiB family redox-sensing transcriptional regulator
LYDLFFPPRHEGRNQRRERVAKAKAVCARCPVIEECRLLGVECERSDLVDDNYYPDGVWGGLTRSELIEWAGLMD